MLRSAKAKTTITTLAYCFLCSTAMANVCSQEVVADIDLTPNINGWGIDDKNHRFIAEKDAGITKDNLARLQVKWVFALPDTETPHSQPFITPNTVFIGDSTPTAPMNVALTSILAHHPYWYGRRRSQGRVCGCQCQESFRRCN